MDGDLFPVVQDAQVRFLNDDGHELAGVALAELGVLLGNHEPAAGVYLSLDPRWPVDPSSRKIRTVFDQSAMSRGRNIKGHLSPYVDSQDQTTPPLRHAPSRQLSHLERRVSALGGESTVGARVGRRRQREKRARGMASPDPEAIPYLGTGLVGMAPLRPGAPVRQFRRPQGAELLALQQAALHSLADAEQQAPRLLEKIRTRALTSDPLMLFSRLTMLAGMRRSMPGSAGFGADATLEFYGGLVTSLPADEVTFRIGTDISPRVLYEMDSLLRNYAVAENQVQMGRVVREGSRDSQTSTRHQLEFEHQFDRMLGYPAQTRLIFESVVKPLTDRSRRTLGFALADALLIADVYSAVLNERRSAVMEECQVILDRIPADADEDTVTHYLATHMACLVTFGAAPVEDLVDVLAEKTVLPRAEVALILKALTTPLGSQAELGSMTDTNSLRRCPVIGLPDGRGLWAMPEDFIHIALDWAADTCAQDSGLITAFDRSRQTVCEQLAHQTLASVFGDQYVHLSPTYPAERQRPDIDVLVATPGATIVVEAKAGRFTDAARRAAPDRVRKKSREFIDKALDQNARTITHLCNGATDLRDKNRRRLTIPNSPHIVSVIVTLDRVDPFATYLPDGGKRGGVPETGTWLVNLADLILTADVLRDPAEFYAYAELRARINKIGGPRIFVETDALGTWCEHRIEPVTPVPGELAVISTTSELMNDYYTFVPSNDHPEPPPRPVSGIPTEVLNALGKVLDDRPEHWHGLATAAAALQPARWATVQRAVSNSNRQRRSRRSRKLARRAVHGIQLSDNLTVYVHDTVEQNCEMSSTDLLVEPGNSSTSDSTQ